MNLIKTTDSRRIARFLCKKPVVYAYPLGYLDPAYVEFCKWYASVDEEGEYSAVVLVYDGLSRPALFTCGEVEQVAALIEHFAEDLPPRVTVRLRDYHWEAVLKVYRLASEKQEKKRNLCRMSLQRREYDAYRPNLSTKKVIKLTHRNTLEIMHLHTHWPNRYFEPSQLDSGLVYGIKGPNNERLISIAAIHNLSDAYDIASISTLATHPQYRRQGYGKICTIKLLDVTFERVSMITLDIDRENNAARQAYTKLGFRPIREFYEAGLQKDGLSFKSKHWDKE